MSIPKEPRQQMINMMYLVLTAMLALNITTEVLNAFGTINNSIQNSNRSIDEKNQKVYEAFQEAMQDDTKKDKARKWNDLSLEVKQEAQEMSDYLEQWKEEVVNKAGGWMEKDGKKMIKDQGNIYVAKDIFVKGTGGDEIKKRMEEFKTTLLSKIEDERVREAFSTQLPVSLEELPRTEDNPKGDWAFGTFNNIPAVAALATMTKFQNDVKNSESMIIEYFSSQIDAQTHKFDALKAIAIPKTSYALVGQEIEATIMLAAYNTSSNPSITSSSGPVPVVDGVGTLKFRASGVGMQTVRGVISVPRGGGEPDDKYDYSFDFVVGSAGASLQLDKMNVMYIGVENPVTLSASGYNIEDVTLNMPGADLKAGEQKGQYNVMVKEAGTIKYSINARDRGGASVSVGGGEVRVRRVPDPVATVGGKASGTIPTGVAKVQPGVAARLDDFVFAVGFRVTKFRFVYIPRVGDPVPSDVTGNQFDARCKELISASRPGDRWLIEDIEAVGPDNTRRKLNPISLTLN